MDAGNGATLESVTLRLLGTLGSELTADVTGFPRERLETGAVDFSDIDPAQRCRILVTYRIFELIANSAGQDSAKSWMVGSNPSLGQFSPLHLIKQGRHHEVLKEAQRHIGD